MDNVSVTELLESLYNMVSEAWGVPLGNDKCIVEREKVLTILEDIKQLLPGELNEAKLLVKGRDEFIGNAKREAEAIRRTAEERARALVDEQEVVRVAKTRASELMATAETKSSELRRIANEYVDDALRRADEAITAAQEEVRRSRSSFRSVAGTAVQPQPVRAPQQRKQQFQNIETMSEEDFE